jgi:CheY-like chemotaxis protein
MSAEVKAHVFEPFFTTKERGKGTGLGLSTVYGIVQQSGGGIWLYSEPGRGTTFKMLFPAVEGAREEIPKQQAESSPAGTETILLAEDEPGLREFIRRSLASHGYSVLPAGNGREALEVARRHEGEIHALITDIVMPEMSGVELARHFAVERQGAKVLMMSGYTDQLLRPDEIGASYIQKPFTAAAVLSRLRSILEA